MNCPNCQEPLEDGAAFCGNCGQSLGGPPLKAAAMPAYALSTPARHIGETKALLSVLFGVIGIVGALFVAVYGLALGVAGLVMGTLSRSSPRRRVSTAGLIISCLAVLTGLGVWVYNVQQDPHLSRKLPPAASAPAVTVTASGLSTACYYAGFINSLQISSSPDNCNLQAFNGRTFEASSEVYKVYASHSPVRTAGAFEVLAKQSLEKDIKLNLAGFTLGREQVTTFAGSPAYSANAVDEADGVAVIETAVLHPSPTGNNVFILLHGVNGREADLQTLESQWQWK